MFRSLEADELDMGNEGKRGIKNSSSVFWLEQHERRAGLGGRREDGVLFGHIKFEIPV